MKKPILAIAPALLFLPGCATVAKVITEDNCSTLLATADTGSAIINALKALDGHGILDPKTLGDLATAIKLGKIPVSVVCDVLTGKVSTSSGPSTPSDVTPQDSAQPIMDQYLAK